MTGSEPNRSWQAVRTSFRDVRPVLFLGAGPSIAYDGPSTQELVDAIRDKFRVGAETFAEACNEVIRYQDRRAELEAFLQERLEGVALGNDIEKLLELPWECVLTTNYDLVAERASSVILPSGKRVRPFDDGTIVERPPADLLPVYKVMGSCNKRYPEPGFMLLSSADRRMRYETRKPYLQLLRRYLDSRALILLGTSLEDEILLDFFEEVVMEPGSKLETPIYLITKTLKPQVRHLVDRYGIRFLPATLDTFLKELGPVEAPVGSAGGRVVAFRGKRISIPAEVEGQMPYAGTLIDALHQGHEFGRKDEFYQRSGYSKRAFEEHWDFLRDIQFAASSQPKDIGSTIQVPECVEWFRRGLDTASLASVLLLGPAGSAKTMTALRFLHDWAARGELGIYVDADLQYFSPETTAQFVNDLVDALDEAVPDRKAASTKDLEVLVVLDNAADKLGHVQVLAKRLGRVRDARFGILVTGHKGDPGRSRNELFDATWELAATVSAEERARFRRFVGEKFPDIKPVFLESIMETADARTFWGLFYQAVTASQEPLEQSVLREYDQLPTWCQDLVGIVATFQRINVPVPESLAFRRFPDLSYRQIADEIDSGRLLEVIYRHAESPVPTLQCLNTTVANLLWESKVRPRARTPTTVICDVLRLMYKGQEESKFLQQKVIEQVSRQRNEALTGSEAARILKVAAEVLETRPVLHHYGKALMRIRRYDEAERQLRKALQDFVSGERSEYVYHSFGELYYRMARDAGKEDSVRAWSFCAKARDAYRKCQAGSPRYAGHGLIKVRLVEARLTRDADARRKTLLEALQECDLIRVSAEDADEREMFLSTRREILGELAGATYTAEDAIRFGGSHHSGLAHYFLAVRMVGDQDLPLLDRETISEALRVVNEGLSFDAMEPALNYMRARLLYLLNPGSKDMILAAVDKCRTHMSRSALAMFRAKVFASNGDVEGASRELAEARGAAALVLASFERSREDLLRDSDGVARFAVTAGSEGKAQVMFPSGGRVATPGCEDGEIVALAVTPKGFVPERVRKAPSPRFTR